MIRQYARMRVELGVGSWIAHGRGRRRAISRSNRRNVMAIRKNFIENGSRAEPRGSKPHSYGLDFSRYRYSCGSQKAIKTMIVDNAVLMINVIIRLIIFLWRYPELNDWKSVVLIILEKYEPHQ